MPHQPLFRTAIEKPGERLRRRYDFPMAYDFMGT
jgi:hypothetical protein